MKTNDVSAYMKTTQTGHKKKQVVPWFPAGPKPENNSRRLLVLKKKLAARKRKQAKRKRAHARAWVHEMNTSTLYNHQ